MPGFGEGFDYVDRELAAVVTELVGVMALPPGARVVQYGWRGVVAEGPDSIADGSARAVLSLLALEHADDPARHVEECWRVLEPGGKLLLSTSGLMASNGSPSDRWRCTGGGLRRLLWESGFAIVEFRGLLGLAATGAQLFQQATAPRLPRRAARMYTGSMQRVIAWLDHRSPSRSHTDNASVLAVLAEKPLPGKIESVVTAFADARPAATFLQIGANDGKQRDPLRREVLRRQWTGMLVEPLPFVFERLRMNYAGVDRVRLLNAAVSDNDGTRALYHLRQSTDPSLPTWYDALGSFRREVLVRQRSAIPDIQDRIVKTDVPCISPETLLDRYGSGPIDLVQVDTEGYDYEILRRLPFDRAQPTLVIYEHHHLSDDDRAACRALLRDQGFELLEESLDTVALHTGRAQADAGLLETWRRVQ
jgi:FkbM family methyltransferase